MLEPLKKIIYVSAPVNRALGKLDGGGYSCSLFVSALIGRLGHPDALVRRLLLDILTCLYEKHPSPKQLVQLHRLAPLLESMQVEDQAVLVRQLASELILAFRAHNIL